MFKKALILGVLVLGCDSLDRPVYGSGPAGPPGEPGVPGVPGEDGANYAPPVYQEQVVSCEPVLKDGVTLSWFATASFPERTAEELTRAVVTMHYTTGYLNYVHVFPEGFEYLSFSGGLVRDGAIAVHCPLLPGGVLGVDSVHVSVF